MPPSDWLEICLTESFPIANLLMLAALRMWTWQAIKGYLERPREKTLVLSKNKFPDKLLNAKWTGVNICTYEQL